MKTDDGDSTTRFEAFRNSAERDFQRFELVVDGDPQGLKRARGRVDSLAIFRTRHATPHQLSEIVRGLNRMLAPLLHNLAANPTAVTFFAIVIDQVGQMLGTQSIEQPPGR